MSLRKVGAILPALGLTPCGEIDLRLILRRRVEADDRTAFQHLLGDEILECGHFHGLVGNLIGYAGTQLRRGAKKLSQKTLGRALFHKAGAWAADAPGFLDQLRASRHFRQALDRLKLAGILAPAVQPGEIRDIHVGRVLAMGMLIGRFAVILPVLAIAGTMAEKKVSPPGPGTFPTTGWLFVVLLAGIILIVGALTFLPILTLGPIVEHLLMLQGTTF